MIIFVFIIAAVVLCGIKPAEKNQYYDACSHRQTSMINGIFTMLILVSHASMYMDYGGVWIDDAYGEFRSYLGQFVVAPFLFYSGFGIMESIAKKGNNYVKSIPQKRFFKVWYHFALALIPFVILYVMWSDNVSISNILLSFTGYKNMGNSSWYMFDIFIIYAVIYLCFMIFKKSNTAGVIAVFVVTYIVNIIMQKLDIGLIFVVSIFCLPAGMAFSLLRPHLRKAVTKNIGVYLIVLIGLAAATHFLQGYKDDSPYIYNLYQITGILAITMLCMKFKIENKIIEFFSKHVFSIYILQRVPMIILDRYGLSSHHYLFIILSLIFTSAIAVLFDKLTAKTDELIYSKRKAK